MGKSSLRGVEESIYQVCLFLTKHTWVQDKDTDWLIVCTGNESAEILEDYFGLGFLVLSVAEKAVSPRLGLLNPIRWRVKKQELQNFNQCCTMFFGQDTFKSPSSYNFNEHDKILSQYWIKTVLKTFLWTKVMLKTFLWTKVMFVSVIFLKWKRWKGHVILWNQIASSASWITRFLLAVRRNMQDMKL